MTCDLRPFNDMARFRNPAFPAEASVEFRCFADQIGETAPVFRKKSPGKRLQRNVALRVERQDMPARTIKLKTVCRRIPCPGAEVHQLLAVAALSRELPQRSLGVIPSPDLLNQKQTAR